MSMIYLVAGARPNFMKTAPIMRALQGQSALSYKIIHTGQHHDRGEKGERYGVVTLHRPGNVDDGERLARIVGVLAGALA